MTGLALRILATVAVVALAVIVLLVIWVADADDTDPIPVLIEQKTVEPPITMEGLRIRMPTVARGDVVDCPVPPDFVGRVELREVSSACFCRMANGKLSVAPCVGMDDDGGHRRCEIDDGVLLEPRP